VDEEDTRSREEEVDKRMGEQTIAEATTAAGVSGSFSIWE
jgi:hypothetical protein